MAIRSFLAFELPAPMKAVLERSLETMKKICPDIRWMKVDKIHITVVFLGNVPEEGLGFISDAAGTVCARHEPFNLALKGVGVFGPPRRPRVIWAGLDGDIQRMAGFQRELLKALEPAGIRYDGRPFKPHLTLGRFRDTHRPGAGLKGLLEMHADIRSDDCRFDELVLFKSDLTPREAIYTVLGRIPIPIAGTTQGQAGFTDKLEE